MQSKRDQVQAHMFLMGRLTSGMLRADPDAPESPQGRTNRGIVLGVVIAVIVAAGSFVIGLISPGTKDSWRTSGDLIVVKETGARYLYLGGRLRPVRNYTSARLLAGADLSTTEVGADSLRGTPRGAPVGITGAPDDLPDTGDLNTGPWQLCSTPGGGSGEDRGDGGDGDATSTLAVGQEPAGSALGKNQGVVVAGPDREHYLLWSGSRLRLDRDSGAPEALGYGSLTPVEVPAALLSALPAGPDLTPPDPSDLGKQGPELDGRQTRVGQVFEVAVPGSGSRLYQLRAEGLAPLTPTLAALVLGDERIREQAYDGGSPTAVPLSADALKGALAPASEVPEPPDGLPEAPPRAVAVPDEEGLCVQVTPSGDGNRGTSTSIAVAGPADLGPAARPDPQAVSRPCLSVDRITVPPGGGALVRVLGADGGRLGGTVYLVTDAGVKHRVVTADAADALGYGEAEARGVSSLLLTMLPSGPDLSPRAAEQGRSTATRPLCDPGNGAEDGSGDTGDTGDTGGSDGSDGSDGEKQRKQEARKISAGAQAGNTRDAL